MIRKPIVAGQFYARSREKLESDIEKCFVDKFGPGGIPKKRTGGKSDKKLLGVISPHAGYMCSGAGEAFVFKEIGEAEFAETYIILGVNHSGPETCVSNLSWETPLGIVECDTELVEMLEKKGIPVNNQAHQYEHSIEVQLPFLQFVSRDRLKELRIVPIMIADEKYEKWGKIIKESVETVGRTVVIICSSDFTHYGTNYGFVPFEKNIKENIKKLDGGAIKFVFEKNPAGFLEYVRKTRATICGRCGIAVLLWLMREMKSGKGELLKYYTSGDVFGYGRDGVVGYASVVFR
jgi:AmmeMemoRadiSam system protein B